MQVISKPSRLLGLFPQFGNGHIGGIQESARIAWQALENQFQTDLLCYSKEESILDRSQADSRVRTILEAFNRNDNHDVVLIWQIGLLKLLPFLRKQNGSQTILFLHGIEAWKQHDWLTRRLLNRVDLFLTNSDYTWERFCTINPSLSSKAHETVPLGLSAPAESPVVEPSEKPVALIVSRISKTEDYKGHRELIDVWPSVLEQIKDAELWIAGEGDLRPELEQLVQARKLDSSIKFLGRVSNHQKIEMLQSSRCFVMPSRGEGFGLVYLEAMRMGRPCLVSTLDAGREVVNPPEAGLAADPGDKAALADALVRMLSDSSEWRNWSMQARQRFAQNYTAAHFQERLLKSVSIGDDVRSVPPAVAGGSGYHRLSK